MKLLIYGAGKIYWDYYRPRISQLRNIKEIIIIDPRFRNDRTPEGKYDAALILSPPEKHFDNINNFLQFSLPKSIVVIEKPALVSTAQTQEIISIFKERQVSGFFATPLRATHLYNSIKNLVNYKSRSGIKVSEIDLRNGFINNWLRFSKHEDKYSALIWDLGPHIFDFVLSILNTSVAEPLNIFDMSETRLQCLIKFDEVLCTFLMSQSENIPGFSRIKFSDHTEYFFDFSNANSNLLPSVHNPPENQIKNEFKSSGGIDFIRTLTDKISTNSFTEIDDAVRSISIIEKLEDG